MKPISLVIDGINSFYDRQEIDFRFDGLFCICGDTGSGKTTILDCIIIALFGSSNRACLLNDYINLRRDKAEIRFVFEVTEDGQRQTYEVIRLLSKTGATKARLNNLTTLDTVAEQTNNVNAALKKIIGLTMEDFTQMVILEQGKFAKFLTASKKERNETVGNLFKLGKYKDLGSKFSTRLKELKRDLDNLDERLDELKDVTQTLLNNKEKSLEIDKKQIAALEKTQAEISKGIDSLEEIKRVFDGCIAAEAKLKIEQQRADKLDGLLKTAKQKADETAKRLKEESERKSESELIAARLNDLENLLAELNKRKQSILELTAEWKKTNAIETELAKEYGALVEKEGKCKVDLIACIDQIRSLADFGEKDGYCDVFDIKLQADKIKAEYDAAHLLYVEASNKVKELNEKVKTDTARLLAANRAAKIGSDKVEALKNEVEVLTQKREAEQRQEAAAYLRQGLKDGDVCPVCGGTVCGNCDQMPISGVAQMLIDKQKELKNSEKEFIELESNRYSFVTRLEEAQKALLAAVGDQKTAKDNINKIVETVKQPDKIDILASLAASACEIERKLTLLQSEVMVVKQKYDTAKQKCEEIKVRGAAERVEETRLNGVIGERLNVNIERERQKAARLNELTVLVERLTNEAKLCEIQRDKLGAEYAVATAAVKLYGEQAALKPRFDINELTAKRAQLDGVNKQREQLIALAASAEKELEVIKADLLRKCQIEKDKADKKKKYDLYSDIYKLVSGDKFIEYIAEEYILQFTSAASVVLSDITGGKYTLDYAYGVFFVNDFLSGGQSRKASTLSGGETFLASLSLAIAISREIARYKTYEFFFLDEGFGTLDSYSIDIVLNALTSLASDTLVGVVTHRSELTERIFDKITVNCAGPNKGSTVVRST